ncbi:PLP-dependent aminotransferase family protein [Streptomyces sp. RKAG293]|uniref:MocR-like pyridoxine biosynthesis transcription factor PdxR n=1 Tax=Streptomyces sp. RKAG293 TaxID=2893403 RepID=UPI00203454B8|nr:PLP-dependent aminotransferase family protein [Streptomyces sp. RKAG293]MCM2422888.1 PLP-dependent aminotransferase family protein [Streptomyces sp. RKAG293]
MELHISLAGRHDLIGQIYRQVRAAVLDGRLRPGDPVPPTRELAARLRVSRNTVSGAYDRLTAEGFVQARKGAGTFVSPGITTAASPTTPSPLRPLPVWDELPEPPDLTRTRYAFDFRPGHPDVRLFPYESWRRLLSRELRANRSGNAIYGDPAGHSGLRTQIARHIGLSRAVRTEPADIAVTAGAQQAFDLIARVLVAPGRTVALEDPGYPPARHMFASHGARIARTPVDGEGLIIDALPPETALVYVTPSHQFPLGMPMSLARKLELLAWADEHDAVIVEDDYDSEFCFGGTPTEPLRSLDTHGRVLYVGTFSKVMLPTLRLGFLVAPPSLRRAFRTAKYVTDWNTSWPQQAALAAFLEEGLLAAHIRRMRHAYRARHARVGAVLARDFTDLLDIVPSAAGLHLSALLPLDTDDRTIARRAAARGVGVLGLSGFGSAGGRSGLVLGYGAIPLEAIDGGLRQLALAIRDSDASS